jgi:two-component system nitrogen regulation response regulator GlnG/two-component system response regulator HydG
MKHDFVARFHERIACPSLDLRRADVPLLARHLTARFGQGSLELRQELVSSLVRHHYTHHVRELERLLRLSLHASRPGELELTEELRAELSPDGPSGPVPEEVEIRAVLSQGLSVADAARRLGLPSRFALYRLMKKLGIEKKLDTES